MLDKLRPRKDEGFTLIELLIVIIVLGILAAIVVFAIGSTRKDSVASSCKTNYTAVERDATMIVLGLTGKNVFARLLAGNVPVELIKNTKVPVLILPPDWTRSL